jgi:hypothetical protein
MTETREILKGGRSRWYASSELRETSETAEFDLDFSAGERFEADRSGFIGPLHSWPEALADFARSHLIGNGAANSYIRDIVTDSEYLDVLKEFGIVGLVAYLAYNAFPLVLL